MKVDKELKTFEALLSGMASWKMLSEHPELLISVVFDRWAIPGYT